MTRLWSGCWSKAVVAEIGADRVGLRISPGNTAGDMHERERDTTGTYEALMNRIAPLGLAYLHVLIDPAAPAFGVIRALWSGTFVLNAGRQPGTDFCQLESYAQWGAISAAAVGRAYLANPDLIDRLVLGAELNEPDMTTFYAPGPVGYTDYPTLNGLEESKPA
ncbi:2,4-dienoyl-CoA reductase-like NADH-dependent reductase (Old Yellow Enzyme family) [Mycobacterium frederiksbergense]|uniref:2,4-dienoyl-CoA reductase-like NADH-dependent reductase (Old Yellow Enzyme family) n=1 Tax=Mycolicibacterium frederiksbergense TaxID=117567 RepID=A0ABT6L5Q7_9MYCO|nr:2,4-dienoyl-CoA reductase-like NADH-dependent reductase (Old Yellow Enzyme family) [Mycolicibacterium frederiksbergense]